MLLRSEIYSRRGGDLSWRYERLFGGVGPKRHVLPSFGKLRPVTSSMINMR
jgi:hypothetical protein